MEPYIDGTLLSPDKILNKVNTSSFSFADAIWPAMSLKAFVSSRPLQTIAATLLYDLCQCTCHLKVSAQIKVNYFINNTNKQINHNYKTNIHSWDAMLTMSSLSAKYSFVSIPYFHSLDK